VTTLSVTSFWQWLYLCMSCRTQPILYFGDDFISVSSGWKIKCFIFVVSCDIISEATLFLYPVQETKELYLGDDFIFVSQLRLCSCSNCIRPQYFQLLYFDDDFISVPKFQKPEDFISVATLIALWHYLPFSINQFTPKRLHYSWSTGSLDSNTPECAVDQITISE
jgi:hypothetical protein